MTHLQILRDQSENMIEEILDRFSPDCENSLLHFTTGVLIYVNDSDEVIASKHPFMIQHIESNSTILCYSVYDVNKETVTTLYDLSVEELARIVDELEQNNYAFK